MRANKLRILLWAGIGILLTLSIAREVCFYSSCTDYFGGDLKMRRNEILCAHQGVNSFHIWNRDITLKGFYPHDRPDRPNAVREIGDKRVHAYPAWHTAFFYFYGWLPELMCISLMSLCYGVCIKFVVDEIKLASTAIAPYGGIVAGYALSMIAASIVNCYFLLNYGILIIALFLLMRKLINSGNQIGAGLCFALMMIKPQIGLLFILPLFWRKKYKTIIVAIIACLVACCVTALLVKENPISLILQIPEIGKPYGGYFIGGTQLKQIWDDFSLLRWVWMGAVFFLCVVVSYWTRGVRDILVASAPITVFIPIWTYSQELDHMILLGWFFTTFVCALNMRCWKLYWIALVISVIFIKGWSLLCGQGIFNPSGYGWLYHLVADGSIIMTVFAAILFSWQIKKKKVLCDLIGGV